MFGSLILPTGAGAGTRIRTGGVGVGVGVGVGGINHPPPPPTPSPRVNYLSFMGSIPYHPTTIMIMSFPPSSRKLPPPRRTRRIRASSFTTAPADDRVELLSKPPTPNLYQILRIKQNASSLEIKTAYRKLAKQFHPDALPPSTTSSESSSSSSSSSSDGGGGGARDFMAIHNAYATLSDPTERARYDLSIQIQTTTTTTTTSSSSSHTRRFHTYYSSSSSSSSSAVDGNEKNRSYGGMQTRRWETDQCW